MNMLITKATDMADRITVYLNKVSKEPWVRESERNLVVVHNTISSRIKSIKRTFFKKGQMMKTFEYINSLHDKNDYVAIERVIRLLRKEMPPSWSSSPRYYKYQELIAYCEFLVEIRNATDPYTISRCAVNLIESLNMGHELGRVIERRVRFCIT